MRPRSFDPPRERSAPRVLRGHFLDGREWSLELAKTTLVVAVKANCVGCREFLSSDSGALARLDVVAICQSAGDGGEWRSSTSLVVVAPELWRQLEIRSAPFYVVIDPVSVRVVQEGVVFGFEQVVEEVRPFLRDDVTPQ
jgi:hypothetical protein